MKTLEWQEFLGTQRERHGKVLFRVAELAHFAKTSPHALNTELARLVKRGVITRYARGYYGPHAGVETGDLLASLDSGAYITGFHALFQHGLVTQVPTEITCFTNRRHNQGKHRMGSASRFRFICANRSIYHKPATAVIASPEQALCDFVYLENRAGLDVRSLVTLRNLNRLRPERLQAILKRYPAQVVTKVLDVCGEMCAIGTDPARKTSG
jgi:hypothetical protein